MKGRDYFRAPRLACIAMVVMVALSAMAIMGTPADGQSSRRIHVIGILGSNLPTTPQIARNRVGFTARLCEGG